MTGLPDASDFVFYGIASLRTGAKAPTGDKISVGCMAKIEVNVQNNALRVTIKATHPAGAQALMQTAKSLLV